MRKIIGIIFFICMILYSNFLITVTFAESSGKIVSTPIADTEVDIDELINELINDEAVLDYFNVFPEDQKPNDLTIGKSEYLLIYEVSSDYWTNVTSFDYVGMVEHINGRNPTIYVPIFGNVKDADGNVAERVVGSVRLDHSWKLSDPGHKYRVAVSTSTPNCLLYKSEGNMEIYERITDYLSKNGLQANQVFVIEYPPYLVSHGKYIAVVQTGDDTMILDLYDSCNLGYDYDAASKTVAYSIDEYRELRLEAEKNYKGNGTSVIIGTFKAMLGALWNNISVFLIKIAVVVAVVILTVFIVKKRRDAR